MATETHIHIYPTNPTVGTEEMVEWAEAITYLLKGAAISAIVTVESNDVPDYEYAYDAGLVEGRKAAMLEVASALDAEADAWAINAETLDGEHGYVTRDWARYGSLSTMAKKVRSMA